MNKHSPQKYGTKRTLPLKTYSSVPWIIAFCALTASLANLVTGIVLLATNRSGGDIALGVLTIVFAVWGIVGSVLALVFIVKQNRYNLSQANFIAQVSHELRTPLTSIRMYADTLKMHRFNGESEENELIEQMDSEIARLERLTEQILDSRLQKLAKEISSINVGEALEHAIQPFLNKKKNDNRLDVHIAPDLPRIRVDEDDFINMSSNLIRNALTHGGDGVVHIALVIEDDRCKLTVRDEGPGIAPEMRDKIFEPFERGEQTTESGIPGFGLGLSIVRDFSRQYGAELDVDNDPAGGAVFSVSMKID